MSRKKRQFFQTFGDGAIRTNIDCTRQNCNIQPTGTNFFGTPYAPVFYEAVGNVVNVKPVAAPVDVNRVQAAPEVKIVETVKPAIAAVQATAEESSDERGLITDDAVRSIKVPAAIAAPAAAVAAPVAVATHSAAPVATMTCTCNSGKQFYQVWVFLNDFISMSMLVMSDHIFSLVIDAPAKFRPNIKFRTKPSTIRLSPCLAR